MKKNIYTILSIIILVLTIGHFLSNTFLFKHLELISYDLRSKFDTDSSIFSKNYNHADRNIVIVAIDDEAKKELIKHSSKHVHHQSWEVGVWKNLVDFIEQGEPKAVLFDMVFEKLNDEPWYNRTFAESLIKYDNIVLGTYLDKPLTRENNFSSKISLEESDYLPTSTPLDVSINDKKLDNAITYTSHSPVNSLYTRHNIMGVTNSVLDDDSIIRKNQPIYKLIKDDQAYYMPSLAFAGFLRAMGDPAPIKIQNRNIYYKDRVIPINDEGIVNVRWHKLGRSYSYVPVSKIILNKGRRHDLKPEFFKDKIVIIGKTATGGTVQLSSIISPNYSSPEAIAVAVDNYINDTNPKNKQTKHFIHQLPKSTQIFITTLACLIVALLGLLPKSAFMGFLNGFISIIFYITISFFVFLNPSSRIWLPIIEPLYYLTITASIVFAFRFINEMTKKASMMNVFGKFVSPKVLSNIKKHPDKLTLKNTKKKITVLFCDVKDFSATCEKHDPEKLIKNLNELFKEIVNIIFENNGTVDKFIGDCIMAYWGDFGGSEDDEYLAVKTALEIKKRINELKIVNAKENKIIFDVRIGINTGEAVLGLAGTDQIMSYTALGEAVNTAARLETACKKQDRDILISKSTYQAAKDKIIVLDAGQISIKGKDGLIEIYEPIGLAEEKLTVQETV